MARQEHFFDNLKDVPFGSYRLRAEWGRYGDLVRPQDRRHYDADAVAIPLTEERYRIRSFDRDEAVEDMYFTFVERNGKWLIAEDTDLDRLGLFSARHPWDFGPVQATRHGRFLLIQPHESRDCAAAPAGLTDRATTALERVDDYWSPRWRKRVVLVTPCDARELKRFLQATFDPSHFVAFAYSTIDLEEGYRYTGHRIVVNPPVFSGRAADDVLTIMSHELLHIASRDASGPFIPLFVDEGLADLVGYAEHPGALFFLDSVVARGAFDGRLPEDFEFSTGTGSGIFLSYQESQSAIRFLKDRWGLPAVIDFYEELGGRSFVPGLARWQLDDALRKTIGIGVERFEREWAATIGS